jgi:hypothetical protein
LSNGIDLCLICLIIYFFLSLFCLIMAVMCHNCHMLFYLDHRMPIGLRPFGCDLCHPHCPLLCSDRCRAHHQLSGVCKMGLRVTDDQWLAWANTSAENAPSFMQDHWHSGECSLSEPYKPPHPSLASSSTRPASYLLARSQISAPVPTKPSQSPQVSAPPPPPLPRMNGLNRLSCDGWGGWGGWDGCDGCGGCGGCGGCEWL